MTDDPMKLQYPRVTRLSSGCVVQIGPVDYLRSGNGRKRIFSGKGGESRAQDALDAYVRRLAEQDREDG